MNTPRWVVRDVSAREDYTLTLLFADGSRKIYDARPLAEKPIYAKLKNVAFFLDAKAEFGTAVWDDDTDIAPEHLYECGTDVEVLPDGDRSAQPDAGRGDPELDRPGACEAGERIGERTCIPYAGAGVLRDSTCGIEWRCQYQERGREHPGGDAAGRAGV